MNKIKQILTGIAVLVAFTGMAGTILSQQRVVEYPIISFSNTNTLDIRKVELTDSNTKVHFKAHFRPHYWIKIVSESYLNADGKKYALTGADKIVPDSLFWMPDSGEADFTLTFQPLPLSTAKFDFIEGDGDGSFKLWNVDISGNEVSEFPEGLPSQLKISSDDASIPDPAFEIGNTTVKFHMLPYIEELAQDINLYINTMDGSQIEYPVKFDNNGDASLSFDQYGTAGAFLVDANRSVLLSSYTFYPGETADCYIDMRVTGDMCMSNRSPLHKGKACRSIHNGKYRDYDNLKERSNRDASYYGLDLRTGKFADYRMNGNEYKAMVKGKYDNLSASIASIDAPQAIKDLKMLTLQNEVLEAMSNYRYFLEHNYRFTHNAWRVDELPQDSIPGKLSSGDLSEVNSWFEIDNPKLLMVNSNLGLIDWNSLGVKGDLSKSINMYIAKASRAKKMILTQEDLDSLGTLSNPFFAVACDSIFQSSKRASDQLSSMANFHQTPDVADDEIFDAIIAPHKGKVILVDLWNTWCGPCRLAIKHNEPLKDNELSDEDIVWIYIADETSDANKYLEMIPGIRGIHYKLSQPQIDAIRNRFDVDGIPYYMLVDRNGNAKGRPDIRNHSKFIREIKALL